MVFAKANIIVTIVQGHKYPFVDEYTASAPINLKKTLFERCAINLQNNQNYGFCQKADKMGTRIP